MRARFTVALVSALGLLAGSPAAVAQGKPQPPAKAAPDKPPKPPKPGKDDKKDELRFAEVTVLHATNSKKGIDKAIGDMPELKRPPFSSYDSYELLSKNKLPLKKGQPKTLKLPNGRVLRTSLVDILPDDYVRLSASINQPRGRDFLPLLEVKAKLGRAFIVAGPQHKNGILVLVIRAVR